MFGIKCTTKKALAVLLSVVIILSMIPLGLAFAETADYTVTAASPAIPMNSLTSVSFSAFNVETVDGTVLGSDLIFTNASGSNSIKVDNNAGTITAYANGVYKVTATNPTTGTVTTLFVVVKNTSDTQWLLYNKAFGTNNEYTDITYDISTKTFNKQLSYPTGWTSQTDIGSSFFTYPYVHPYAQLKSNSTTSYLRNASAPGIVPFTNYYTINTTGASNYAQPSYFVLNDEAVNAFSDYTITVDTNAYSHQGWTNGSVVGHGIFGRAALDESGALSTSSTFTAITANSYYDGGYTVNSYNITGATTNSYTLGVADTKGATEWSYLLKHGVNTANAGGGGNALTGGVFNYSVKYEGTTATMWSDADTNGQTFKIENVTENKGAVGIICGGTGSNAEQYFSWVNLREFTVALNNKAGDQPAYTDISGDLYTVAAASPAIPMNSLTEVAFSAINVETADGTVLGSALTFKNESGSGGIKIDNTAGTITAYQKGVYKVTATNAATGTVTTLFVVVKDPADTTWYLYNESFGTNNEYTDIEFNNLTSTYSKEVAFPTGWTSQVQKDSTTYTTIPYVQPYDYTPLVDNGDGTTSYSEGERNTSAPGVVPFGNSKIILNQNGWSMPAYYTLSNEAVNAFTDYTISDTMQSYNHQGWDNSTRLEGNGIFGRATVNDSGALDPETAKLTGITAVNRNQTVRSNVLSGTTITSAALTDGNSASTWSYLSGKQTNNAGRYEPTAISLTVKFDGTTAEIYSANDTGKQTFTMTNVSQNAGAVGILAGGTSENSETGTSYVNLRTFSVALNNAAGNQPAYTDITGSFYRVSDASPAIPMNADTRVNTSEMIISVNGTDILGAQLTFTNVSGDDGITVENGYITAYKKGSYKVKVTNGTDTDYIWVVVKNAGETDYVLYNADFSGGTLPDNSWKSYYKSGTEFVEFANQGNYREILVESGRAKAVSGYSPFYIRNDNGTYTYGTAEEAAKFGWGNSFYFYSTNEIFGSFSDYTVDTQFYGYANYHGGWGIFGRTGLTNGVITSSSATTGMLIVNGFGRSEKGVHPYTLTASKSTATRIGGTNGTLTSPLYTWPYANGLNPNANAATASYLHNFTVKFSGENLSTYTKATDSENLLFETTTTNVNGKGAFGFHTICNTGTRTVDSASVYDTISQHISINYVKVLLNATEADAPDAELLTPTVYVPANAQVDLTGVAVLTDATTHYIGEEVQWQQDRNEYFEIHNDILVTFKEGIAATKAIIGGKEYDVNVVIGDYANVEYTVFAPESVVITPDASCTTLYNISGADGLAIIENGNAYAVLGGQFYTAYIGSITVGSADNTVTYSERDNAADAENGYNALLESTFSNLGRKALEAEAISRLEGAVGDARNLVKINAFKTANGVMQFTYSGKGMSPVTKELYVNITYSDDVTANASLGNLPIYYNVNQYAVSGSVADASVPFSVDFARTDSATYSVKFADGTVTLTDSLNNVYASAENTATAFEFKVAVSNGVITVYVSGVKIASTYVSDVYTTGAFIGLSANADVTVTGFKAEPTLKPQVITVENVSINNFSIVSDNTAASDIIKNYVTEATGTGFADASKYQIVIAKADDADTAPEKYDITYSGGVFTVSYGDNQSAELAAEVFCNEIIGIKNADYVMGVNTLNVTANTAETSGQYNVLTKFALFADTHIGRIEGGSSWYLDEDGKALYSSVSAVQSAWQADPTGYLTGSHTELIESFKHIALLAEQGEIDFMLNNGDIIETGYNYTADESNRCWEAYNWVLTQSGLTEQFYSVASGTTDTEGKLPYYEIVGNHDPSFVSVVDDSYAFITNKLWYSQNDAGDTVAYVAFRCDYINGQGVITDADLATLEANLKEAANSGATQILVFNHYPAFRTSGGLTPETEASVSALCNTYGAHLYMGGHIHTENWDVRTDGVLNNVDVGWAVGYDSSIHSGTYAIVTVTDKKAVYEIYACDASDITTRTPVRIVTVDLASREAVADSESVVYEKIADISGYRGATNTAPAKAGYVFGGWYSFTGGEYVALTAAEADAATSAYAKFVTADVLKVGWQIPTTTTAGSASTDLRLVSTVDSLNYRNVVFTLTAENINMRMESSTVYSEITGYVDGKGVAYAPTLFSNASYRFMTHKVTGVPNAYFELPITVTANWTTKDGTYVSGEPTVIYIAEALAD